MSKSLKSFTQGAVIGAVLLTGMLSLNMLVIADEPFKVGGNGYQCLGAEENRWKTGNSNSATLPNGLSLKDVVVKAGQGCYPVHPVNNYNDCYSVNVSGQTVTVTKIGQGNTCQDISHLEGTYTGTTDPVTPPQPPVTPPQPPEDPADPTPTPAPSNNNSNSNSSSNNSSSNSESEGEVLGAYAGTGVAEDVIMNALGSVGGLMTVAGSVLYGKKKRS